jgi:shikimate dehydrogenase
LEAGSWLQNADLLIQTTPVGMSGEDYVLDLKGINPAAWVVDLIYHPVETSFLADAARQGCQTMNGLDMLLYQGVLAWKFWLNLEAPVAAMRRALLLRSTDPVRRVKTEKGFSSGNCWFDLLAGPVLCSFSCLRM